MRLTDRRYAALLMAPAALYLLAFVGYPMVRLVVDSLYEVKLLSPDDRVFVGLANYIDAISSPRIQGAAARTLVYTAITLTTEFVLGFAVALLFNAFGHRSEIARTIFIFPLMIPAIVAGLLWRFLLIDGFGIVNELLARVGILSSPDQIGWLSDRDIVLFSVALPDIWLTTSFVALIVYAGLQTIPPELNEAARVDGASALQVLRRITIPLLRPVIAVVLIIRGIDAARAFDVIVIQTEGGPNFASELLSLNVYREMIRFGNLGQASATATLFLLGMLVLALITYVGVWQPGRSAR
jgi:multiple sugar transport system permease protein